MVPPPGVASAIPPVGVIAAVPPVGMAAVPPVGMVTVPPVGMVTVPTGGVTQPAMMAQMAPGVVRNTSGSSTPPMMVVVNGAPGMLDGKFLLLHF